MVWAALPLASTMVLSASWPRWASALAALAAPVSLSGEEVAVATKVELVRVAVIAFGESLTVTDSSE